MQGLLGRLGDLGTIPEQYDTAVTTACSQLDCFVVDTVSNGEACIKYLRETKAGRGNFICLDKVQQQFGAALEKPYTAPNNSERLYDLITANEARFKAAFYLSLRDTIVCKDLKDADAIASGN